MNTIAELQVNVVRAAIEWRKIVVVAHEAARCGASNRLADAVDAYTEALAETAAQFKKGRS